MCIGRFKEGMVKESVWKGNIAVDQKDFFITVSRPRRDVKTGKSVYVAQTEYNGEIISVDKEAYSMEDAFTLLRSRLKKL
jgi:hypothetical protein